MESIEKKIDTLEKRVVNAINTLESVCAVLQKVNENQEKLMAMGFSDPKLNGRPVHEIIPLSLSKLNTALEDFSRDLGDIGLVAEASYIVQMHIEVNNLYNVKVAPLLE